MPARRRAIRPSSAWPIHQLASSSNRAEGGGVGPNWSWRSSRPLQSNLIDSDPKQTKLLQSDTEFPINNMSLKPL